MTDLSPLDYAHMILRGEPVPGEQAARKTIDEKIAWLRADCAARDALTARANRAFDVAFRCTIRQSCAADSKGSP